MSAEQEDHKDMLIALLKETVLWQAKRIAELSEPAEQDPVDDIWYEDNNGAKRKAPKDCQRFDANGVPAAVWVNGIRYTAPQPAKREPLTVQQINEIEQYGEFWENHTPLDFARAIEAAHGIGGQT